MVSISAAPAIEHGVEQLATAMESLGVKVVIVASVLEPVDERDGVVSLVHKGYATGMDSAEHAACMVGLLNQLSDICAHRAANGG